MERSFADTLKTMSSYFSTSLKSSDQFGKLLDIAEKYPSLISKGSAFETRLNDQQPALDMFFAIEAENKTILAGTHPTSHLDPVLFVHPVWRQIRKFFAAWCIPGSSLERNVDKIFLEYDADKPLADVPVPAVFMQINDNIYLKNSVHPQEGFEDVADLDIEWVFQVLGILKNGPVSSGTIANVQKCFKCLMTGSKIDHMAIMSSRTPDVMRINITGLDENRLYSYLEAIGLGSRLAQIKETLPEYSAFVDHLVLALDVSDAFSPRIGIELRLPKNELNLHSQSKWLPLLDHLVEKCMCLREKRDGLVAWSGKSRELFDPELYRFMIYRYINLVKLVFEPNKPPVAKAYFSFVIRPFQ